MIDLNEISRSALETAKARERKGQLKSDTMSILKHCAGEVCEAVEQWGVLNNSRKNNYNHYGVLDRFSEELADIITCALIAAANEGVDIEAALLQVQEKNKRRAE
ncbi:MAG: hypothetical protein NC548_44650 [Lachnospiraceae bacterium]|nr:hypothetical protein [Lachnospiraceae bacterium]